MMCKNQQQVIMISGLYSTPVNKLHCTGKNNSNNTPPPKKKKKQKEKEEIVGLK